jgi:hypothetical protein
MLPFERTGKIISSVVLALAATALLWFVVFPWAEPILPFDDVQVSTDGGEPGELDPGDVTVVTPPPSATVTPSDEHDLPYSDVSNNPVPTRR